MPLGKRSSNGMSIVEVMAIAIAFVGSWYMFYPVYQRYVVSSDFRDAIGEISYLQEKTSEFVAKNSSCPEQVGQSFPGGTLFSGYSLVVAPFGFSHGCIIRGRFGPMAHMKLRDKFVEMTGIQNSGGLLSWSCRSTVDRIFLPSNCDSVPVVVFP